MAPPAHCNVVGSYVLKTMVRSQRAFAVDMIVEMPRALFQEKDYLNLRYFYKRAYYLAHIARAAAGLGGVAFVYHGDNPLLPILELTPTATPESTPKRTSTCQIRIIPCCPDGLFPRAKLLAAKNCLRPDTPAPDSAAAESTAHVVLPPTPFYNATLKAEAAHLAYLKLLHQAHKSCLAFGDACMLGRVWLQQRGLGSTLAQGGFGAFEWAALVALLLQTGSSKKRRPPSSSSLPSLSSFSAPASVLSPSLSSTQIFKAVIQFLASTDFRSKPCILGGPTPDAFLDALKEGTPVLFDTGSGRQLNIAYRMSAWSAGLLRQHARWTHELLRDDGAADTFTPTFIARADLALEAYDQVLRIRVPGRPETSSSSRRGAVWDFADSVFQVLRRAMGDRARLVHIQLPPSPSWSVGEPAPAETAAAPCIVLGIVFDAANMARHLDHGPAAEDKKEARKFREFWGERAELRRFKDGSILETLVWTAGQSAAGLCEEITRYILGLRLGLTARDAIEVVSASASSFDAIVPLAPVTDAAAFTLAREAFATLEHDLRALEDLPLHIRQVVAVDAALRSATIRPPAVHSAKAVLRPLEVVLFFEASGKWPDSLVAIQRAKMAFLLRIGESLEAAADAKADGQRGGGQGGRVETSMGLENTDQPSANLAYLDIAYHETAAFRLRIHSDLEEAILARQARDKTLGQHVRTASAQLLAASRRRGRVLPVHTQVVATFCTRFPALSPTMRLAKRWFSGHKLLQGHVSDELVELLVLHVFLHPQPWQAPASAAPALLRVLQFLARWDWRTEPLVVNTSDVSLALLGPAEGDDAPAATGDPRTRLEAWRKIDPGMHHTVLFVATSYETSGTAFTAVAGGGSAGSRPQPSKVVAARMTSLARAACRLVRETDAALALALSTGGDAADDLDPRLLFQPSLADYDVLLHLSPRVIKRLVKGDIAADAGSGGDAGSGVRRHHHSVYRNLDARTGRELHPLPTHPVQLLVDQLNEVFGGSGAGSAGSAGGSVGPMVFFHSVPDADGDRDTAPEAALYGHHVVAALWNPQVRARPFRVNLPCSFRPVAEEAAAKKKRGKKGKTGAAGGSDDDEAPPPESEAPAPLVEVNRGAILAEIARIGGSLIERIEVVEK